MAQAPIITCKSVVFQLFFFFISFFSPLHEVQEIYVFKISLDSQLSSNYKLIVILDKTFNFNIQLHLLWNEAH